jgi:hypothetical protein
MGNSVAARCKNPKIDFFLTFATTPKWQNFSKSFAFCYYAKKA